MIILGISGVFGHDAAAAIIVDDEIVSFIEEERIIRDKRAVGRLPINSTKWCLKKAGIEFEDIDIVAIGWDSDLNKDDNVISFYINKFLKHFETRRNKAPKIISVSHHIAHAAYTIASSGYQDCAVVVVDGHAEKFSTSIGQYKNGKIEFFEQKDISQSLGHFMEAVSEHVGLGRNGVGKLMGLAGYGKVSYNLNPINIYNSNYEIKFNIGSSNNSREAYRLIISNWEKYLTKICPRNKTIIDLNLIEPNSTQFNPLNENYRNLAATAQDYLTRCMIEICNLALSYGESKNLVLSGGVALNCAANGAILRSGIADSIHIAPASGDAGTALGAAIYSNSKWTLKNVKNPFLGPSYSDEIIHSRLNHFGIKYIESKNLEKDLAIAIANKKIVGRFTGAMEAGPRALGNRSILAIGNSINTKNKLNYIKTREQWRPLAPAIISDNIREYSTESVTSKYMLFALTPTEKFRTNMPGAIHVDNTIRLQEVIKSENQEFHRLLKAVQYETGIPALLNTSFNNWREPIVCTPDDAIRTFYGSGIDLLQIGSFIIEK